MSDDVDVGVQDTSGKKGFSALLVLVIAVFCLLGGYGAGALTGGPVLAVLGLAEEPEVEEEVIHSGAVVS